MKRKVGQVVIRAVNLAWQLAGDARLLRTVADGADALILVECRNKNNEPVNVAQILGPDWIVFQNLKDGSLAGTAIAIRRGGPLHRRFDPSVKAASRLLRLSRQGHKVQARYLRDARLRDADGAITLAGVHAPLRSTGLQDDALAVFKRWWKAPRKGRRLAAGDGNNAPRVIAETVGAGWVAGGDVMFAVWSQGPWDDEVTVTHRRVAGSDHFVLTITYPLRSIA